MILDTIRESSGTALAVEEERIVEWMKLGARLTGISICPETATCIGAVEELVGNGSIHANDRVVIFNCGALQKSVDIFDVDIPFLEKDVIPDWDAVLASPDR